MINREDLKTMRPETVSLLFRNGDLDHLLSETEVAEARLQAQAEGQAGVTDPASSIDQGGRRPTAPRRGRKSLRGMTPEQIVAAHRRGELDGLLSGQLD